MDVLRTGEVGSKAAVPRVALMKPIALAWIITLPAAAALSALAFVTLRSVF